MLLDCASSRCRPINQALLVSMWRMLYKLKLLLLGAFTTSALNTHAPTGPSVPMHKHTPIGHRAQGNHSTQGCSPLLPPLQPNISIRACVHILLSFLLQYQGCRFSTPLSHTLIAQLKPL